MEKVFWLMWIADFCGNIRFVGGFSVIAAAVASVILVIASATECDTGILLRGIKAMRWLLLPIAVATITPNSRTIHLLAVASAADVAASTVLGSKGMQAIDAVLDKVIQKAKEK